MKLYILYRKRGGVEVTSKDREAFDAATWGANVEILEFTSKGRLVDLINNKAGSLQVNTKHIEALYKIKRSIQYRTIAGEHIIITFSSDKEAASVFTGLIKNLKARVKGK